MKTLDTYIIEKILINKDTKLNNKFVFKPKSNGEWDKKINNLTVYLPFDIIITNNNEHITIDKITHGYNDVYDYDYWDIHDRDDNRIAGLTSAGVYNLFINNAQIQICLFKNTNNKVFITSDAKILKNKESNIQEKLLISKDTPEQRDYSKFGEGVEKQFSECKIYKKDSRTEISDYKLKVDVDKYFKDDDNVFVITEIYPDRNNSKSFDKKLNDDFRKIIRETQGVWQHVYLLDMQRGYYLKIIDNVPILVIKDFYKTTGKIKQTQYIIN